MVRALQPPTRFSRLKTVYSARNGAPTKAEERFVRLFVLKRIDMSLPVLTKPFYSQPRQLQCQKSSPYVPKFQHFHVIPYVQIEPHINTDTTIICSTQTLPHPVWVRIYARIEILALRDYSAYTVKVKTPQAGTCKAHLLQGGEE